jgi:hypothetical protein
MITEDYCSFEVAKLLKKKGFDELCIFKYNSEGVRMKAGVAIDEWQNSELDDDECSCVSHQMAMKWLREIYDIFIVIRRGLTGTGWVYSHEIYKDSQCWYARYGASYDTYEEAIEAAIKYCLENLI